MLSREYCEAPENRAAVERLAHESDATCAWAAVLDVHVFADSTFDWSVTDSLLSRLHTVDPHLFPLHSPICLARPVAPVVTPCGHVYCWACLLRHASYAPSAAAQCPLCGAAVRPAACRPVRLLTPQPRTPGALLTLTLVRRAPGCTAAYPAQVANRKSGDDVELLPPPARLPDRERDGAAACVFARYSVSGDRAGVARRQLAELSAQARECTSEGDEETLVFVHAAMAAAQDKLDACHGDGDGKSDGVEATTETTTSTEWTIPIPEGEESGARELFYQAVDGSLVFLERVDTRMLLAAAQSAHGGRLPRTVAARVLACTDGVQDARTRHRVRATAFLPLGAAFALAELDLRGTVEPATYAAFAPTLRAREAQRRAREAQRREEARRADVPLCRTALFANPSGLRGGTFFRCEPNTRPTEYSEASFPSLSTPSTTTGTAAPASTAAVPAVETEGPRPLSYAEVARAAAAASRPLSIAAEEDFPSLSLSSSSTTSASSSWGSEKPQPSSRSAAFVPQTQKTKRQPSTKKATNKPRPPPQQQQQQQKPVVQDAVVEEVSEEGWMVPLTSKKNQQTKGRGKNRRPQ